MITTDLPHDPKACELEVDVFSLTAEISAAIYAEIHTLWTCNIQMGINSLAPVGFE